MQNFQESLLYINNYQYLMLYEGPNHTRAQNNVSVFVPTCQQVKKLNPAEPSTHNRNVAYILIIIHIIKKNKPPLLCICEP